VRLPTPSSPRLECAQCGATIDRAGTRGSRGRKALGAPPRDDSGKESELNSEERRLANFVDFIGEGRGSQTLANALIETEGRVEALRSELDALRRSRKKVFQTPPVQWIEERLSRVKEVLERRMEQSALLLRDVLGTIRLEPQRGDVWPALLPGPDLQ
jgi:hypothetical protein